MDQQKIGRFLRELRRERSLTQEEVAEILGVSNRSVSRWENGVTMPDLDLLIQIARYYDVEVGEILDGGKKGEDTEKDMDKKTEETMLKIAEQVSTEKIVFSKKLCYVFIAGLAAYIIYMVIDIQGLTDAEVYSDIADFMLGLVFGDLLLGVLYSSRYMTKIRAFKRRVLKRGKK